MKFEIAEAVVANSSLFLYLRLFMIEDFTKTKTKLKENNPESNILTKLTPVSVSDQYKNILFELVNNLDMEHHKPDEFIVLQNDIVMDGDDVFMEDAKVFFIMTGTYVA